MRVRLSLVAAAICCAALPAAQAQDKWVVGQSAPLSGSNAKFGTDIRAGAGAWFAAINARGGVQGRPLELVAMDDKNDRATAGTNTKALLQKPNLLALFGYGSATLSLDAMPQAEAAGVPFVAPFSGANPVRAKSQTLFTTRASYGEEMERILGFWTSLGFKQVTVLHYDDEVGRQNLQVVTEYLQKIKLTPQAFALKRNASVGKAEVDAMLAQKPELILNTVLSGALAQLQKEMAAQGKMVPTSSLSFVGADQFIVAAGPLSAGVSIAQVVPSPSSSLPAVRECDAALEAAGIKDMNSTQLEACFGAKVLVEAIRRAKKPVTAQGVREALANLGTYDLGGFKVHFSPDAHHGSKFVELALVTREGVMKR
ncbi:ABC transporter substrate-binding protein [uncultured Ramlibacter sp.]|uniref:ABC transporter substrate-binding protein n=1 Tax=uncultured Ramlibacter sp. TaxID=260755 RepID=UPI00261E98AE|nr:ABC transporter substrate-binding protein [uncultured Ramlibacter sp.]